MTRKRKEKDLAPILATNLRNMMRAKEIYSATQLSKETGLTSGAISSYASGRSTPRKESLEILANYFGVDPSEFYVDNRPRKIEPVDPNSDMYLYLKGVVDCMSDCIDYFKVMEAQGPLGSTGIFRKLSNDFNIKLDVLKEALYGNAEEQDIN